MRSLDFLRRAFQIGGGARANRHLASFFREFLGDGAPQALASRRHDCYASF
jgi:hypothetical protein